MVEPGPADLAVRSGGPRLPAPLSGVSLLYTGSVGEQYMVTITSEAGACGITDITVLIQALQVIIVTEPVDHPAAVFTREADGGGQGVHHSAVINVNINAGVVHRVLSFFTHRADVLFCLSQAAADVAGEVDGADAVIVGVAAEAHDALVAVALYASLVGGAGD